MDKSLKILQHFLALPNLEITSEAYAFRYFKISEESVQNASFLFPKHLVLGMQAEACFQAYLEGSRNHRLLAANIQIQGAEQTLGELDFLIKDENTRNTIHIELACKFYLYDPQAGTLELEKWIGPNRRDSLFEKLEKVKTKQFPLLHRRETLEILEQLDIFPPISQQLCLKAQLFVPQSLDVDTLPENFRPCVVGHYVNLDTFLKKEKDNSARFALPTKKEWLLPQDLISNWRVFSAIEQEIQLQIKNKKSPLVYKKTNHGLERFFVVWW